MAEFSRVEYATYSPTRCFTCQSDTGPYIDTHTEELQIATAEGIKEFVGHVYICFGCVWQMAHLADCLRPEVARELNDKLHEQVYHIQVLEEELAAERDNKMVRREDFEVWLKETVKADAIKGKPGRPRKNAE